MTMSVFMVGHLDILLLLLLNVQGRLAIVRLTHHILIQLLPAEILPMSILDISLITQ